MVHKEVSKMPKYPLFGPEAKLKDYIALPINYGLFRLSKHYQDIVRQRRIEMSKAGQPPSKILGTIDRLLGQYAERASQTIDQEILPKISPRIAVYRGFWRGASKVDRLYTVEFEDQGLVYEMPVYLRRNEQEEPSEELLRKNIEEVVNTKKSPYNGDLGEFNDEYFTRWSTVKYSRNDYNTFIDPRTWNKWFVRDDLWDHQQYGGLKEQKTITVGEGAKTKNYIVRAYSRPGALQRFWYWLFGDIEYDILDKPFDMIQRATERGIEAGILPDNSRDILVEEEYKNIAGLRRVFFRTGRRPLEFDLSVKEAIV